LPDPSFFGFATQLLDRYEFDERVFAISGSNFVPSRYQHRPDLPYRFSQIPHIWGWASWRRSWAHHRLDLSDWHERLPSEVLWARVGQSMTGALYWGAVFDMVARGQVDTWDYQFVFASMCTGQLTATSNVNLTENIGFGEDATHAIGEFPGLQPVGSLHLPLAEVDVIVDLGADAWTRKEHFRAHRYAQQSLRRTSPGFREFVNEIRELSSQASSSK
jgi:hypothetical protein